ncbi:Ent-kaurenoic acid oxidase 1 [Acorus calamus]|uniref:Ent-kaurenoic acid oxidase 1 n=1 Tax=Acorus calamus TaxID=4465 RepID=A0AAV9CI18_ACOCL|nr:Ent-kaurenoic acid oxidase 1 [Acorus calamus]
MEIGWLAVATMFGAAPLLLQLIWHWNELYYLFFSYSWKAKGDGEAKLPPGWMGVPFFGDMLSFLWFFKIVSRPNDFIRAKKESEEQNYDRYGEGVGLYKSHLFGEPSIIACSPAVNKFILQSADLFPIRWPDPTLLGKSTLATSHGDQHRRLRNFVLGAINRPESLARIALSVQPGITAALQSWAEKGSIVTFQNICKMFVSLEAGPLQDKLDEYFTGLVAGFRAQPFNFPGTAYRHALQCRKKLTDEFRRELVKRKQLGHERSGLMDDDLMDRMMKMKDEQGMKMGDDEVVDNITNLILGGYEATSLSIVWAVYHLAKSPDVLRRLRNENKDMSEMKGEDFLTVEDVSKLKYTAKVIEETIRLANVSVMVFRRAAKDVNYQGYKIPKDWKVLIWLRTLHMDPLYFDNPLSFNPDRWNAYTDMHMRHGRTSYNVED